MRTTLNYKQTMNRTTYVNYIYTTLHSLFNFYYYYTVWRKCLTVQNLTNGVVTDFDE